MTHYAMGVQIAIEVYQKGPTVMKTLKSWVVAVLACSAITSHANADVLIVGALADVSHYNAVRQVKSCDGRGNTPVETQTNPSRMRAIFVSGSLINSSSMGSWLMAQCVRRDTATQPKKTEINQSIGRRREITPIPATGTEVRPISTFDNFVHKFRGRNESDVVQTSVRHGDEIVPRTSNMTLIGLFALTLAAITAVISVSRNGLLGITANFRRSRRV